MSFLRSINLLTPIVFVAIMHFASPLLAAPRSTDDADIILEGLSTSAARILEFQQNFGAGYPSGEILSRDGELLVSWPTNSDKRVLGNGSIIGSFSKDQNTWVWAWDNQTVPTSLAQVSFSIKDFSQTHGIDAFLESPLIANLSYAEKLASVAILFDEYELIFAQERQGTIIFLAVKNIAWQPDG